MQLTHPATRSTAHTKLFGARVRYSRLPMNGTTGVPCLASLSGTASAAKLRA
jgi:hypothetical protein